MHQHVFSGWKMRTQHNRSDSWGPGLPMMHKRIWKMYVPICAAYASVKLYVNALRKFSLLFLLLFFLPLFYEMDRRLRRYSWHRVYLYHPFIFRCLCARHFSHCLSFDVSNNRKFHNSWCVIYALLCNFIPEHSWIATEMWDGVGGGGGGGNGLK